MFLSEKDWQNGERIFRHETVGKGKLDIEDHSIIYVLSGKFTLSYHDKRISDIDTNQISRSTVKSLESDDLCCIFDIHPVDMFDTDRKLKLHLTCTGVDPSTSIAEYIAVSTEKLTEFLTMSHLHNLKHFFTIR